MAQKVDEHKQPRGSKYRRPQELVPSLDYCEVVEALGPREQETTLAFIKRMGALKAARDAWFDTWDRCIGMREEVAARLGIGKSNVSAELRYVGLTATLLNKWLRDKNSARIAVEEASRAEEASENV